jgi:hypothetical protein
MVGGPLNIGNFARTGNTPAQRAQDSANNLAMLRTQYSTEIRFDNTAGSGAVYHTGPGMINYDKLLLVGPNVAHSSGPSFVAGMSPAPGSSVYSTNCAIHGSGGLGFSSNGGLHIVSNGYACGGLGHGMACISGGLMALWGGGSVGNSLAGVWVKVRSSCQSGGPVGTPAFYSQFNGQYGTVSDENSVTALVGAYVGGNATVDMIAQNFSFQSTGGPGAFVGTMSPANGVVGNYNSGSTIYP